MADEKKPADAPSFEAMAAELNPRGMPYRYAGITFEPGVWVDVTPEQAAHLARTDNVTVRQKEIG